MSDVSHRGGIGTGTPIVGVGTRLDDIEERLERLELDVMDYGAEGDGTTDDTEAIQAAFDAAAAGTGEVFFPEGTYKITAPLYLASESKARTFKLRGTGRTTILKPTGFNGTYLLRLNEDEDGKVLDFPRHPQLVLQDMAVDGVGSVSASLLWYNEASFQFKNLTLERLLYGAYGTGYTDLVKMDSVYWANQLTNGWLYKQGGMGDGFEGRQLFAGGSELSQNMVWLLRCHGATIESCIGGCYRFEECSAVDFRGNHHEERTVTEQNHTVQIINSEVSIDSCNLRSDVSTYETVYIDDNSACVRDTQLTLRNNVFVRNLNSATTVNRDVRINALNDGSKVTLEGNRGELFNADFTDMSPYDFAPQGIRVRSAVSALDTEILSMGPGPFSDRVVIEKIHGNWTIHPIGSLDMPMRVTSAPTIASTAQVSSPAGDQADATYYYRAESLDAYFKYSAASAEVSIASTGTNSVKLTVTGLSPHTILRIMRGTAADTYDRYVDIPVVGSTALVYDRGTTINQATWNVGAYTHHTTAAARVGTRNVLTGKMTLNGTAAPTVATWVVGDKVYNTATAVGDPLGWACTTAGTPGTWTEFGTPSAAAGAGASNLINIRDYEDEVVAGDWAPAFAAAIADFSAAAASDDPCGGIFVPASVDPYTVAKPGPQTPSIDLRGLSNFVLAGDGHGSVIQMDGDGGGASWHMIACGGDSTNITIKDLTLDGNKANLTNLDAGEQTHTLLLGGTVSGGFLKGVNILNCNIHDADGDAIAILPLPALFDGTEDVTDVNILHCRLTNCDRSGVSNQRNAQRVRISHCYFEGIADQDIDFEPSGGGGPYATRQYIITNNTIVHSTEPESVTLSGISSTDPSQQNIFAHNTVIGGTVSCNDAANLMIYGNHIESNTVDTTSTVRLLGALTNVRFFGNRIVRPTGAIAAKTFQIEGSGGGFGNGVQVENNWIHQYVASDGDNCVVMIKNAKNVTFRNNEVKSFRASSIPIAVKVTGTSANGIDGATITGNDIIGSGGGSVFTTGVKFEPDATAAANITVSLNNFTGCTNQMEFAVTGGGSYSTYPIVIGNRGTGTVFSGLTLTNVPAMLTAGNQGSAATYCGNGDPEGVVTAAVGSTFQRLDGGAGTSLYIKESGSSSTGWVAL